MQTLTGLLLPFFGTALGAALVFCMRGNLRRGLETALNGVAAGVMTAASVWSLLLPAIAQSERLGRASFLPPVLGFWAGVLLMQTDGLFARLFPEDRAGPPQRTRIMSLAVVLHNIPEGLAVGVAFAGVLCHSPGVTAAGASSLAFGIALQNVPEGAIISMPLHAGGMSKRRAFVWGVLSGAVEPVAALLAVLAAGLVTPGMPYFLSFAAGAMISVAVAELIPALTENGGRRGMIFFALGFTLMLALDVAF